MAHHEKIDTMLDDTIGKLGGGAPSTTPEEGVNLVEDWIVILRTQPQWEEFVPPLEQLRDALDGNDLVSVQRILKDLAGQTAEIARAATGPYKSQLDHLATQLKDFSTAMAK